MSFASLARFGHPLVATKLGVAMTYDLYIGDRTFSSWSLRGWLMLETFGLPFRTHKVDLYSSTFAEQMAPLAPARLVPALKLPDGTILGETLAMAETLAERHPDLAMWPADPAQRATARWLAAEMCSGFPALRGHCPMQLNHVYQGFDPTPVLADLERLATLWELAGSMSADGDWLFGAWTLADVFYAPVAARIVGYDLPAADPVKRYASKMIRHPAFIAWREEGQTVRYDPVPYAMDLATAPWPG